MSRIAVDCDGTIFKWAKYPDLGEPVPYSIDIIKRLIASGHQIFIWTCRGKDAIMIVEEKLKELGVNVAGFNMREQRSDSPKIDVDLFIDDKAAFCPLIQSSLGKPYVDWLAMELWLQRNGYYTIPLGESNESRG